MRKFKKAGWRVATAALAAALLSGGTPAAAAPSAQAATPDFPSWLMGYDTYNLAKGTSRSCTAIQLTETRELTGPDCFTGRTSGDSTYWYHGGMPASGGTNPMYHASPDYVPATRQGAFAVTEARNSPVSYTTGTGRPTLATSADSKLYAAGATATFYSWAGQNGQDDRRTSHTEQVSLLSPATCAVHLGHPQAAGTFCTLPKPGTTKPDHTQQCLGDTAGALMSGGKLIGLSATSATGCVAPDGVRVYVNVTAPAFRSQALAWSRDVYVSQYVGVSGSVITEQGDSSGRLSVNWPALDQNGHLPLPEPGAVIGATTDTIGYTWLTQAGDLDGDGRGDLFARTRGGALYRYAGTRGYDIGTSPKTWLANGFDRYTSLFSTVDFSGDGVPDLIARDTSGNLWLYKGNGTGGLTARAAIGSGWNGYNLVTGRGDLSGDGLADIVARDSAGSLWLFRGNGKGGYTARTKAGTGFGGYQNLVASGDMDNDGRQDILGRTPGGGVFILNADSKGGLLPGKLLTKTGWRPYSRIS